MWRYIVGFAAIGMFGAHFLNDTVIRQSANDLQREAIEQQAGNQHQQSSKPRKSSYESYAGRTARIKMDQRGHFVVTARMNGRKVEVLVDTGATSVAINRSTARRLGIHLNQSDFKYKVNTANGSTKAASATIDRIQIGRVEVRNVRAAVLSDRALTSTLLGMAFLGELKGFEVKNRELILTQ